MKKDFVTIEIAKKLKEKGYDGRTDGKYVEKVHGTEREEWDDEEMMYVTVTDVVITPRVRIWDVLKWLRAEKNIDVEVHAEVGILGCKVYIPYISTYTEFALEASPEIVRYRQKKFNTTTPLKHEIIPAHKYFEEWEEAALDAIEYVLDNIIKAEQNEL